MLCVVMRLIQNLFILFFGIYRKKLKSYKTCFNFTTSKQQIKQFKNYLCTCMFQQNRQVFSNIPELLFSTYYFVFVFLVHSFPHKTNVFQKKKREIDHQAAKPFFCDKSCVYIYK